MRSADPAFVSSLVEEVSSICRLWIVEPEGNHTPLHFTDSDVEVTTIIDEATITFKPNEGFEASAVAVETGGGMQGFTMSLALAISDDDGITAVTIDSGRYDQARTRLYGFNRLSPTALPILLYEGFVGRISYTDERSADFDIVSITEGRQSQIIIDSYSKVCRTRFCSSECKLNKEDFTYDFVAENVNGETDVVRSVTFDVPPPDFHDSFWSFGRIEFTSGKNAGIIAEIASHSGSDIHLYVKVPYKIEEGDTGRIFRGCSKQFKSCKGFNNAINFRGEPFDLFTPQITEIEEQLTRTVYTTVEYEESYQEYDPVYRPTVGSYSG